MALFPAEWPTPIAFLLSGGVFLGAVQIGMIRAAPETGLRPDLLVGGSAGALNAAASFFAQTALSGPGIYGERHSHGQDA